MLLSLHMAAEYLPVILGAPPALGDAPQKPVGSATLLSHLMVSKFLPGAETKFTSWTEIVTVKMLCQFLPC